MDLIIEKALKTDLPEILAIYLSVLDQNRGIISLNKGEEIFEKMATYPNYTIYIAKLKGKIVGTFALLIMDNLAHLGTPSAIIEDVAVLKTHQNQGIGKLMMELAMQKAKESGCYKLVLSSNLKRNNPHDFYENLGFEKHGFSFLVKLNV